MKDYVEVPAMKDCEYFKYYRFDETTELIQFGDYEDCFQIKVDYDYYSKKIVKASAYQRKTIRMFRYLYIDDESDITDVVKALVEKVGLK